MTIRTLKGPEGFTVTLDTSEVFFDDPGQGTPAIVTSVLGRTSTFWCALNEGTIGDDDQPIPYNVSLWLSYIEEYVNEFLYAS